VPELEHHIKRVNEKLQQLLKEHLLLRREHERQEKIIGDLQQEKEKNREQVAQLEQQVSILKAATGKLEEPEKKKLEKTINQYIREIDKCIALLSE